MSLWQQEFNGYETIQEGEDPFGVIYNVMINAAKDKAEFDSNAILTQSESLLKEASGKEVNCPLQ